MQSARIDEIDRKGRTDTDDADGMTALRADGPR